jgi:hypothetical protein
MFTVRDEYATSRRQMVRFQGVWPALDALTASLSKLKPHTVVPPALAAEADRLIVAARHVVAREPGQQFLRPVAPVTPVTAGLLLVALAPARAALVAFREKYFHPSDYDGLRYQKPFWLTYDYAAERALQEKKAARR